MTELAKETGGYLTIQLNTMASKHPKYINNVRGKGTYLAFDCETPELKKDLISHLKAQGVNQGGCGVVCEQCACDPLSTLNKSMQIFI